MHARDWKQFLTQGAGKEIAIAQISPALVAHLGASSDKVFYRHDYAMKAFEKHTLKYTDFALLFDVVEFGEAFADRAHHVLFIHRTPRGWFQVAVKCAQDTKRLYVATFYKTNQGEVDRKKRHVIQLR